VLISDADPSSTGCTVRTHLKVPALHRFVTPLVYAVPVQLIAYYTAVFMGTDVDQPRNLAKSVTVE
jgi:glucosamine--fructose-6-phosphate aminotransferase (isomerizing)